MVSIFSGNIRTFVEIILRGGYYEKIIFGIINFYFYSKFFRYAK